MLKKTPNSQSFNVFLFFETYKFRVFINIFCRVLCISHVACLVLFIIYYKYVEITPQLFLPILSLSGMLIEGFFVIFRNAGKQSKWFSICMYLYLISVIPYFWILTLREGKADTQIGRTRLEDWPKYFQQLFYILIVFLRVLLPKYNSSREQNSNVIKFLLNIVSDAQELQSNVSEFRDKHFREKKEEGYEILVSYYLITWTWSLPLFCLNVDETLEDDDDYDNNDETDLSEKEILAKKRLDYIDSSMIFKLFRNFYWKFIFIMLLIDVPYLIIRLLDMFYFKKSLQGGYFFAAKNGCQVVLGIHRVFCRIWAPSQNEDIKENENNL